MRVLLLSMPFGALEWPSLGVGLLQAGLARSGHECDARYLTFEFADAIGCDEYQWLCHQAPYAAFAGDWAFTRALHGEAPERDARFLDDVLRGRWRMSEADVARVSRARAHAQHYLDHCLASIDWSGYDLVGFTSTFQQNLASLALARLVKDAHPGVRIVFGGANWEDEMGVAMHRRFPFVDYACSGESDLSFPALVDALDGGVEDLETVPGIVFRAPGGGSVATPAGAPIRELDRLPIPDFADYFRDLERSPSATGLTPVLLLETARGCWWGAKHHCTFCGLNGGTMAFRSKSPERVLEEVRELYRRSGVGTFSVVDNILDQRFFTTLLPSLASEPLPLRFSWEVKANLTRDQVRALAEARIDTIQPGIESFNDHVLTLMDKGTTALRNIQLLKWCRQFGVTPAWNLLFGFPGETAEDYEAQLDVIERIRFLDPPSGWGPVRLDRFSPYFDRAASYGIVNVRPMEPYRYLYPFPDDELMRIASYFDFDYEDGRDPWSYAGPVVQATIRWMNDERRGGIWLIPVEEDELHVVDDRPGQPLRRATLNGWKAAAYRACDEARKPAALHRESGLSGVTLDELVAFLDRCVDAGVMISDRGAYLSLAIEVPPAEARTELTEASGERLPAAVG